MEHRQFGNTGIKVSVIGFGAWAIGGPAQLGQRQIGWGNTDDAVSRRTLETCLDVGINFIDTADVYGNGHSETLIGEVFKGRRDQVVICSKGGNRTLADGSAAKDYTPGYIRQACEASLRRLQTDYIDIYLFHTPRGQLQFMPEDLDILRQLQAEGKIRVGGISVNDTADGLRALACGAQGVQIVYNVLQREPEVQFLPDAAAAGVGVIARVPLASGFLTGKYDADVTFPPDDHRSRLTRETIQERVAQVTHLQTAFADDARSLTQLALQFCKSDPGVSVVIPGARSPEQVRANAAAGNLPDLSAADRERIDAALRL